MYRLIHVEKKKKHLFPGACIVEELWCRMVRGKGRRGISFAWRHHRFFLVDFLLLLLAMSYGKLDKTGKETE